MGKAGVIFSVTILLSSYSFAQTNFPLDQMVTIPDTLGLSIEEIIADQNHFRIQAYSPTKPLYYGMPVLKPNEQYIPNAKLNSATIHHLLI